MNVRNDPNTGLVGKAPGLRRAGAALIVAADVAALPLATALRMGADQAVNLAADPQALAPFTVDKGQFDVMFEASGNPKALLAGLEAVAPRGVVVAIGLGGDLTLPMNTLVARELELRGTFRFHPEFATAVAYLNQGLVDGRPVISDVVGFENATDAFRLAADKSRSMKVQLAFDAQAA